MLFYLFVLADLCCQASDPADVVYKQRQPSTLTKSRKASHVPMMGDVIREVGASILVPSTLACFRLLACLLACLLELYTGLLGLIPCLQKGGDNRACLNRLPASHYDRRSRGQWRAGQQ